MNGLGTVKKPDGLEGKAIEFTQNETQRKKS